MDKYTYAIDIYDDLGHFYDTEHFYDKGHFYEKDQPLNYYETSTEYPNSNEPKIDEEWGHFVYIDIDNKPKVTTKIKKYYKTPSNTSSSNTSSSNTSSSSNPCLVTNFLIRISSTTLFTIGVTYLILSVL